MLHEHDDLDLDVESRIDDASLAALDDGASDGLVQGLRDTMSAIVRPARARRATVTVAVDGAELVAELHHDGAGQAGADQTNALDLLRRQAEQWGASVRLQASDGAATLLRWTAPVSRV